MALVGDVIRCPQVGLGSRVRRFGVSRGGESWGSGSGSVSDPLQHKVQPCGAVSQVRGAARGGVEAPQPPTERATFGSFGFFFPFFFLLLKLIVLFVFQIGTRN